MDKKHKTLSSDRTLTMPSENPMHNQPTTGSTSLECSAVWGARSSQAVAVHTHPSDATRPVSRCSVGMRAINPALIKVIALVMLLVLPAFAARGGGWQ